MDSVQSSNILLVEPFYCGSHRQLADLLAANLSRCDLHVLPGKKWHWKARTAALTLSQNIPYNHHYRSLFCSSVLNLADLVALRPDLAGLHKVLYFHENQLIYPVRKQQERDFQYGYNQIVSCLVADVVVFNSKFNMESFLGNIQSFLKLIPDSRPRGVVEKIRPKCRVIFFPVQFPTELCSLLTEADRTSVDQLHGSVCTYTSGGAGDLCNAATKIDSIDTSPGVEHSRSVALKDCLQRREGEVKSSHSVSLARHTCTSDDHPQPLHIVWPHRWEHDKDPETFFQLLYRLADEKLPFQLAVLGETFAEVPVIFAEAYERLSQQITHWGYQQNKGDYYAVLRKADVVVSTAKHEFYGVAMLEAAWLGCYPLAPNRLSYPEIFPGECLYNTNNQLYKRLRDYCQHPGIIRRKKFQMDFSQFSWSVLEKDYVSLLDSDKDLVPL